MTEEEKDNWKSVYFRKSDEGFEYCFVSYSEWEEIEDSKFHELRTTFLKAMEDFDKYIELKYKEATK